MAQEIDNHPMMLIEQIMYKTIIRKLMTTTVKWNPKFQSPSQY